MPLLRRGVLSPVKGIDFSVPAAFIDDRSGFPTNVYYYKGELRKRPGKSLVGGAVSDATPIMGMGKLELNSGLRYAVRASQTQLERYVPNTDSWTSILTTPFTSGEEDFCSFATVTESGLLIITNGLDAVRQWDGSSNESDLGGSPPKARFATYLSPYLLLAHTDDGISVNPWKIAWSDTDDPTNWTTGNSGEALLSDEPSAIQNIAKQNEFVAGYKQESLSLGVKVESADVFRFQTIKTGIGLASPRAFADAEGVHYFMGANNFYAWNGPRVDPIGEAVRDEVFATLDRNKIDRCFAMHVQELNEVWWFVVSSGNAWPTNVWKYNYRNGFWYYDTCDQLTCALKWERTTDNTWDSWTGSWDSKQTPWNSGVTVQAWEDLLFGTRLGTTQRLDYTTVNDNGVAVAAQFDTKDFVGEAFEQHTRWLQFDVWAKGAGRLYVDYSADRGETWVNIPYTSSQAWADLTGTTAKYEWYFDVVSPTCRYRVRNDRSNETFYLQALYPYFVSLEDIRRVR